MSDRFELRCRPGELEAWRLAAGDVPLGRWLRRVANEAAASRPRLESHAVMGNVVTDMHTGEVVQVLPERPRDYSSGVVVDPKTKALRPAFSPDFKKGGKR